MPADRPTSDLSDGTGVLDRLPADFDADDPLLHLLLGLRAAADHLAHHLPPLRGPAAAEPAPDPAPDHPALDLLLGLVAARGALLALLAPAAPAPPASSADPPSSDDSTLSNPTFLFGHIPRPMRPTPTTSSAIARTLAETDHFRRAPGPGGAPDFKEWQHFLVRAPGLELLVNFSLQHDLHREGAPELARLIVLARTDRWRGGLDTYASDFTAPAGALSARLGASTLDLRGGAYHLDFAHPRAAIAGRLELHPLTTPALSHNIRLAPGRHLSWLMVPRLAAHGVVHVAGRRFDLAGDPAYHDHNWGHFRWGDDFAWEWGSGLPRDPASPWSLIFVRMADRARTRAHSQGLFLWRGADHHRFFRDRDLRVTAAGAADRRGVFKLPPVLAVLHPGDLADVPRRLDVECAADGDRVHMSFEPSDVAQLLIPDERRSDRLVILNEACGRLHLRGEVRGESIDLEGDGVFEFIR